MFPSLCISRGEGPGPPLLTSSLPLPRHVVTPCSPKSLPPSPPLPSSRCLPACPPHHVLRTQTHSQARALNTPSPPQLSHPISAVPQPPSQSNFHTHTGPCGKVVINPGPPASFQSRDHISKVREAGEQETVRGRFGGGAGKKKSVAKDKKKMRWLVSDTLEDKETKNMGSQSSRNGEMGWGGGASLLSPTWGAIALTLGHNSPGTAGGHVDRAKDRTEPLFWKEPGLGRFWKARGTNKGPGPDPGLLPAEGPLDVSQGSPSAPRAPLRVWTLSQVTWDRSRNDHVAHFPPSKRVTPSPGSLPGMTAACPQVPHLASDDHQCPAPSPTPTGVGGRGCRRPQRAGQRKKRLLWAPHPLPLPHLPSGPPAETGAILSAVLKSRFPFYLIIYLAAPALSCRTQGLRSSLRPVNS